MAQIKAKKNQTHLLSNTQIPIKAANVPEKADGSEKKPWTLGNPSAMWICIFEPNCICINRNIRLNTTLVAENLKKTSINVRFS